MRAAISARQLSWAGMLLFSLAMMIATVHFLFSGIYPEIALAAVACATAIILAGIFGWIFGPAYQSDHVHQPSTELLLVPLGIVVLATAGAGVAAGLCALLASAPALGPAMLLTVVAPVVFVGVTWVTLLIGFMAASAILYCYATSRTDC